MIAENIGVTGPIPRNTDFEDAGGPFFLDSECTTPDPIADDQAVWLNTKHGTVVLVGCAHAGVVNTLDYIARQPGFSRFYAVGGGLHLRRANEERLARTAAALNRWGVERLHVGHCTGESAEQFLAARCRAKVAPLETGLKLEI